MLAARTPAIEAAVLVAALLGCSGPSLEELTKQHRPAIDRNLAAVPRIRDQIQRLPRLDRDGIAWSGGPLLVDGGSRKTGRATAAITYLEHLADPTELGFVPFQFRVANTGLLNHCAALIKLGHEAYDPALPSSSLPALDGYSASHWYPACAALQVLFVIRTLEFAKPSDPAFAALPFVPVTDPDGAGVEAGVVTDAAVEAGVVTDAGDAAVEAGSLAPIGSTAAGAVVHRYTFEGGAIRGEVLAFELSTAKLLGGFRFAVASSTEVTGSELAVQADLAGKLVTALREGIRKHVPNATFEN
jgi:hypothetical protein